MKRRERKNGKTDCDFRPLRCGQGHGGQGDDGEKDNLFFSVSATTRPPRPGEVDGKDYYFVNRERFLNLIHRGEMLEYDEHNMNFYGTPKQQVEEKRRLGHVLLDIEPIGARNVKNNYPEAVLVFIMPPSVEELEHRLRGRNDTPEDQITIRMERAKWEMEQRTWYDHVVVNDDPERCADEILRIIET